PSPLGWSSSERQRAGVETSSRLRLSSWLQAQPRLQKTFEILLHSGPDYRIPGPGLSVPDARIPCMATVFGEPQAHPVAALVARLHADLEQLGDPRLWTMSEHELAETLAAVAALRHRFTELELRVATQADHLDIGAQAGAADTASWWANQTRQTKRDTKRRLALATALDHDHEPVRDAMAAGQVSEEQAAVIVKGVDALPVEHRRKAEAHLIGCAAEHDPV